MDIHQMNVGYDARQDRILWQVRGRGGEMFRVWLTRRMLARVLPPLRDAAVQSEIASRVGARAAVTPEARAMFAQTLEQRALKTADFKTPFDGRPGVPAGAPSGPVAPTVPPQAAMPLGDTPLLPTLVDISPGERGGVRLRLREEAQGRSIALQMGDELTAALLRLIGQAVKEADWALPGEAAAPPAEPAPATAPLMN